jgi:hypothetical protein
LADEPKSVRETYIRVAVIDIDIMAGAENIYIGGGRCKRLVLSLRLIVKNIPK